MDGPTVVFKWEHKCRTETLIWDIYKFHLLDICQVLIVSELKCCKLCGAFLTCDHKSECCPECQYFDESDMVCLAPESLKKKAARKSKAAEEIVEDIVDDDTFLFDDDEEEEEDEDLFDDEEEDDMDFDDELDFDDDW